MDTIYNALNGMLNALASDATLAIAFSGGLDSTVLLHATVAYAGAARCLAFHIHHGLSPKADLWLAHCEAVAHALGARLIARFVTVQTQSNHGIEAAARDARYRALGELCNTQQASALLLGHHADDQVETVLLQLLRGAGPAGIAAMPAQRLINATLLLRPLLTVPRVKLEAYAIQHHLQWIEDETNQDLHYARNALRHAILPTVTTYFPAYRKALTRAAHHAADSQKLLDELAAIDLPQVMVSERCAEHKVAQIFSPDERAINIDWRQPLSRAALRKLSRPRAANLIRYWMRILGLPTASSAWMNHLFKHLYHPHAVTLRIDHAGYQLCAYRDQMSWKRPRQPTANTNHKVFRKIEDATSPQTAAQALKYILYWRDETVWPLMQWGGRLLFIQADENEHSLASVPAMLLRSAPLSARTRQGGERLRKSVNSPSRTLKNLFQEASIPAWRRHVPLIYLGQKLLFVPYIGFNHGIAHPVEFQGEPRVRLAWYEEGPKGKGPKHTL